jgi:serine protease Do
MNTQQIIELYRPAIIQIATQTSTGTGFYIKEFDLIATNEHVVGKNAEVTIAGRFFERRMTRVW